MQLPKIIIGRSAADPNSGSWLGQNFQKEISTPVVDDVVKLVGGTCTIFQRMNEDGDMLRIATNVANKEGRRAIGTYIAATDEKGVRNPVIENILKGNSYSGRALVVDSWYITNYSPLKDEKGNVIGMAYVGVKQSSVDESLRNAIMNIKIGESGYVCVLGGGGSQLGQYIVSPNGSAEGENVYDVRDASGKQVMKDMIDASKASGKKNVFYEYQWQNKGEASPRLKVASLIYFDKWDWVISATVYPDEFNKSAAAINSSINNLSMNSIYAAVLSLILALLFTVSIGNGVGRNITEILNTIKGLTENILLGNLNVRGDKKKVTIEFAPVIEGLNSVMDTYNKPIEEAIKYIGDISNGVLPDEITEKYHGDFNKLKDSLNNLISTMDDFSVQMKTIHKDHSSGELDVRLNMEKFKGVYNEIVDSVSKTINYHVSTIMKILNVTEEYGIKGDFSKEIDRFPGKQSVINKMFDGLKNNLQNVIFETKMLVDSGVEGRLKIRGDETKFVGGYREIIAGINKTLDSIIKPVEEASKVMGAMAEGDLSVEMTGDYVGDHAILKNSLNSTINSMNGIISQVLTTVGQVETGSTQVSSSSQSLSQSATEQASALQQIGATMQQINSQAKQNEHNAVQANSLAVETRGSAEGGNEKMVNLKKAMSEINEASGNVAKIIKAIDEIAFQTNLLALNAAVEAARAGKHGKGFTVVAEEVRNLAQRSAKAAKETAEMIESSIKKAMIGSGIAEDTSKSLAEINLKVAKVTDIISEISSASKEQAAGTLQINQGLSQLDRVTQQNTATAEQAAAASEELSSQASELKSMLRKFKLRSTLIVDKAFKALDYSKDRYLEYTTNSK